ncbi:peptidylprolyl isomerase [Aliiroseovarius sp. KMU-50]|uniref:Parvulin-like PPIase n=1 Tax=Aliiroseovarius salicola TaxID=3009082 RepID=A0ABT4W1U9_9RHOB|nr:peptidylprolyl isomerase [Aliiroseovarius sp. KMU-50]MDA5094482.1 peptidylprolyl isomerase [Aliiroseovarius sp. KMU-50]
MSRPKMTQVFDTALHRAPKAFKHSLTRFAFSAGLAVLATALPVLTHGGSPAMAQGLFEPVVKVNDRAITAYELSQRVAYLTLLRAPGDPNKLAKEQLITEALQRDEAKRVEIALSPEELKEGMEEFTQRFQLTLEKFEQALAQGGVEIGTFRDFVEAGLLWRKIVREKFRRQVRITEADIDRQLELSQPGAGVRVLLSEIILPAHTPEAQRASSARSIELAEITTLPAFAAAARSYSVAPSKGRSGRLDWVELSNLPPALAAQVLPLAPGAVTDPLPVQNGIALFQMRAIEETDAPAPTDVNVDYATYLIPGGNTETAHASAAAIRSRVDSCDDLYPFADGQPEEQLVRETKLVTDISQSYAIELAKLDPGESSIALTSASGQNLVFLMLCGRSRILPEEVNREDVRLQLQNQRLASFSKGFLEELHAEAFIKELAQ